MQQAERKNQGYLLAGLAGSLIILIGDCLVGWFDTAGSFALDYFVLPAWAGASPQRFVLAGVCAAVGFPLFLLGCRGLYQLIRRDAGRMARVVFASLAVYAVLGMFSHGLQATVAWTFQQTTILDSEIAKTISGGLWFAFYPIVLLGLAFLAIGAVMLCLLLFGKRTRFPRWAALFNPLLVFMIAMGARGMMMEIPAAFNALMGLGSLELGGALMFGALFLLSFQKRNQVTSSA